jgi:hypothetical protein
MPVPFYGFDLGKTRSPQPSITVETSGTAGAMERKKLMPEIFQMHS